MKPSGIWPPGFDAEPQLNQLTIRSRLSHQHRNGKIGEHRAQGQGPSLNGQALARQRIEEPLPSLGRYEQAYQYYTDYVALGGESGAREAGKLRQEGKEYLVQDGDVMLFKFNV